MLMLLLLLLLLLLLGCNFSCSYCIIPSVRGKSRSYDENHILNQVQKIAQNGFKEVVLPGTNIGSFGAAVCFPIICYFAFQSDKPAKLYKAVVDSFGGQFPGIYETNKLELVSS